MKYFAPYEQHTAAEQFYTSNYDLFAFSSIVGAGVRIAPLKPLTGNKTFEYAGTEVRALHQQHYR